MESTWGWYQGAFKKRNLNLIYRHKWKNLKLNNRQYNRQLEKLLCNSLSGRYLTSQTLFSYLSSKDRSELHTLYRQTVRKMLFLHKSTPSHLIDKLIQYQYKTLHLRFRDNATTKTLARLDGDLENPELNKRVDYMYSEINTDNIPPMWTNIWNLL